MDPVYFSEEQQVNLFFQKLMFSLTAFKKCLLFGKKKYILSKNSVPRSCSLVTVFDMEISLFKKLYLNVKFSDT